MEKAEAGNEEAIDLLDDVTYEDFKGFSMDIIYRFSKVTDVYMTEYFSREELLEEAYITQEEYDEGEFAGIHAEEI
mgnify:CR=1 FL=1